MASKEDQGTGQQQDRRNCPNCYYPLPRFGQYCSHCGQKYTDGKVTVMSLVRQFMSDSLNLDAKIWRTLLALMVPGRLTRMFFEGKQQRYVRPLRLFFVFTIITIAAVSFFEAEFAEDFFVDVDDAFSESIHYGAFVERLDTTTANLKQVLPAEQHAGLDSLFLEMTEEHQDSMDIGVQLHFGDESEGISSLKVAKSDIANLPLDSIVHKYGVTNFWEKMILRQNIRLQKQGDNFAAYMLNQVVWMMLLIMPILALFMKMLYIRRSYFYVEHLIFSFHVHAFLFFVLTVLMLLDSVDAISEQMPYIWVGGILIMSFYFYKSLRNVYRQSRFKTVVKYGILTTLYAITFIIALVLTVVIAALSY